MKKQNKADKDIYVRLLKKVGTGSYSAPNRMLATMMKRVFLMRKSFNKQKFHVAFSVFSKFAVVILNWIVQTGL